MFEAFKNKSYSRTKESILDYILINPNKVKDMSLRSIAKATYVAPSTVVRFCRKCGFHNYYELQDYLKNNYALKKQ